MFCAAISDNSVGKDAPQSVEEVVANARHYGSDDTFMRTLASITTDVLTPLIPRMWDDLGDNLMQLHTIPAGGTYQINIESNDVFLFEDSAIGSGHSATYQYLYGKTLKLRAESFTAQTKIDWYRSIVNGTPGDWYRAFMGGLWNKMYAMFMDAFKTAAADLKYIPSGNVYNSYTSANFTNACVKVAAINGIDVSDLIAYGGRASLAKVLPTDGTGGAIAGLQYQLGKEWFEKGFLPNAGGVDLVEAKPVVVPGTQNTSVDLIGLDDTIYIFAKAGRSIAPMQGVLEDGSPLQVTLTPDKTADFTFDVNMELRFNVIPVFAAKGAVIKNV